MTIMVVTIMAVIIPAIIPVIIMIIIPVVIRPIRIRPIIRPLAKAEIQHRRSDHYGWCRGINRRRFDVSLWRVHVNGRWRSHEYRRRRDSNAKANACLGSRYGPE